MSSTSHTSCDVRSWTSRRRTTVCCRGGGLGLLAPRHRLAGRRPVAGVLVAGAAEPGRVDPRAGVAVASRLHEVRPEHEPAVAGGPATGAVGQDRQHPGAERRTPLEVAEPADHAEPGVLDDVLRRLPGPHERAGDAQHRRRPRRDQLGEGGLVAGPQRREQLGVPARGNRLGRAGGLPLRHACHLDRRRPPDRLRVWRTKASRRRAAPSQRGAASALPSRKNARMPAASRSSATGRDAPNDSFQNAPSRGVHGPTYAYGRSWPASPGETP
jgi:hypothetical protein